MTSRKYSKITISGQICTGKTTLYQALSQKLGWQAFSTGAFFREYAAKHKLDIEAAQEQNEQITKKIDYKVRDLLKTKNHIIVEGWLAGIMAAGTSEVLKILLICSASKRAHRFAQREETSQNQARRRVKERDQNWLAEISKIYRRNDIFSPKNYDLVIDTTQKTPSQILQAVIKKLQPTR
jgi:CMP/dCMP kinase